jgi:hypothetical protein
MGSQADAIVPRPRNSLLGRTLSVLAVAAAVAAATAMGVRPLTSPDLGYHLAYGEEFLDTGRPVDTNPYLYTNPAPGGADSGSAERYAEQGRPPPGPGCWYDEQGRYRFANANWLTQAVMAGVWRLGRSYGPAAGFSALSLLQAGLSAALFLLVAAALRRMGRGEGVFRGEGVSPLRVADILSARTEGIPVRGPKGLPSVASSSAAVGLKKTKREAAAEKREAAAEKEARGRDARDTRGQDVRDTQGRDPYGPAALATQLATSTPWWAVALGVLLAAMATYPRRELRPELFGYVLLAAELTVLAGGVRGWRSVAALIALQALFVNFHSYFLLGLLLTAAMLGDSVLRLVWARWGRRGEGSRPVRVPPLRVADILSARTEGIPVRGPKGLPSASSSSSAARASGLKKTKKEGEEAEAKEETRGRDARGTRGQDVRDTRGQDALATQCALATQTLRHAVALAGQAAVCFLNPWTWRGAILPIQTLLFLREGGVGRASYWESRHPWAVIGEFAGLAGPGAPAETKSAIALYVLVGLACAAAIACVVRRRWGRLAILVGMSAVAMSMRRNIAPGAIVLAPVACGTLFCWPGLWLARRWPGTMRKLGLGACAAAIVLSGVTAAYVVSQKFYTSEDLYWRFGWGPSRMRLPLDAAEFLNRTRPVGRLWVDYDTSSNFHFLTHPHQDVPILTNTWAYPPAVLGETWDYLMGERPFEEARRKYGVEIVAFFVSPFPALARELAGDANWRLSYLDPMYAVYLRADGPNAELAKRLAITPANFDANGLIRQARDWDPVPSSAMHMAGCTLYFLGWYDQAIDLFRASLEEDPRHFRSWEMRGLCHARRGQERLLEWARLQNERKYGQADEALRAGREDWRQGEECFRQGLSIEPGSSTGRQGMDNIGRQLKALEHGEVIRIPYRP